MKSGRTYAGTRGMVLTFILLLSSLLFPRHAEACEPMYPFLVRFVFPSSMSGSALGLLAGVVLKCALFALLVRQLSWLKAAGFMFLANIITSLFGFLLVVVLSIPLALIALPLACYLATLPSRSLKKRMGGTAAGMAFSGGCGGISIHSYSVEWCSVLQCRTCQSAKQPLLAYEACLHLRRIGDRHRNDNPLGGMARFLVYKTRVGNKPAARSTPNESLYLSGAGLYWGRLCGTTAIISSRLFALRKINPPEANSLNSILFYGIKMDKEKQYSPFRSS